MRIYNLGSLNIDCVYQVDHFVAVGETLSSESMTVFPGGKGLNQSIALAKAGSHVIHGAVIGANGDFLLEVLERSGVETTRIKKSNGACGHAIIQVDKTGQNCILLYPGTNRKCDRSYIEEFLFDAAENDVLLLQNEMNCLSEALEIAHNKKMQIAFNPSPFPTDIGMMPTAYVKWWFCNEIEGRELVGGNTPDEIAALFVKQFPESNLILTLGEDGSMFVNADGIMRQPIYETQVVDTTAAGDTFSGYFLAALISGRDVAFALDVASKASAITVSRRGASSSIPVYSEVCEP